MNNFIVIFTIFFCTIYFGIVLYFAWNGEYVFDDLYKVFLEYCLFIFASENPKYHCRYARFLALNLCFTDLITWINTTFSIVTDSPLILYITSFTWSITIAITIYLAIRHFRRARAVKKRRNYGTNE